MTTDKKPVDNFWHHFRNLHFLLLNIPKKKPKGVNYLRPPPQPPTRAMKHFQDFKKADIVVYFWKVQNLCWTTIKT